MKEKSEMTEWELSYPQLRFEKVAKLFSSRPCPTNLLDIGCGTGAATEKLREVLHLDIVDGVDLLVGKISSPSWLRLKKVDIDEEDLPYPDGFFESIYCGEVIEHLVDPDHLLNEMYRVLSPTGFCVVTTPNLASWFNRILLPLGFQPFFTSVSLEHEEAGKFGKIGVSGHKGHLRVFTWKALRDLLKLHQFKIDKVEGWEVGSHLGIHVHSGLLGSLVKLVDRPFTLLPSLASRLAVVVVK